MCLGNMAETEVRMMADPRVVMLNRQYAVMEDLRMKFMATDATTPDLLIDRYEAFIRAWRNFRKMVDAL